MNLVEQLIQTRKYAGLPDMSQEQVVDLAEKKLSGQEKEDFMAKMSGKKVKKDMDADGDADDMQKTKKTKKDAEVDDGRPGPSKDARKSMDMASIKPKGKKKVSEQLNAVLEGAGLDALSEADATKIDMVYAAD
jgi:uncharacterized Zn finger protein